MDAELSDEQELLRDSVRRFLSERASLTDHVRPLVDGAPRTSDAVWPGLVELGVVELLTRRGELDLVTAGLVIEEAGRALLPEPYLTSAVVAAAALRRGDDGTGGELLDAIGSGSRVATLACHEPGRRYEWRTPTTRARARGDPWTLTGVKQPVLHTLAADTFVVTATHDEGLGLFVVDAKSDGVSRAPVDSVDATRMLGRVTFDDVRATRVELSDAVRDVRHALDVMGSALVVDGVGAATAALELTIEYARARRQFGVPIGSFQAVQHLCADMLRDVEMARVGAYHALWAGAAGDDEELHRAAVMASAHGAEVLPGIGESAIQVFGGIGFTWEHDIHLFYRRMLSATALTGTPREHYSELARLVLD